MKTRELSSIGPRDVRPLELQVTADAVSRGLINDLRRMGINLPEARLHEMRAALAADALTPGVTAPSMTTPVQFLQAWLPGFVRVLTQARKIDDLVGVVTAGSWEDEEVVQGVMELTGQSVPYGDYTNVPLSSWNVNFERRTIVRFEEGLRVGRLEEARASRINVNTADAKREAAAEALDIQRNSIGFYGYNDGDNRTYGFLNDPSLPAYETVAANGTGDTEWSDKDFLEITADIREAVSALRTQSGDRIDPRAVSITLAVSTDAIEFLSITNALGTSSVADWIAKTYPNMRIESAPELNGANGGDNVFYLYAESVTDGSTDDRRTFVQIVPARFMTLGVEQQAKAYIEDFTNATAGVMVKRPYAVVRRSGI
jgi:hypothetical protein